jgi:NADH dehydrogenase
VTRVLIVGGGFAGLNAAKLLGAAGNVNVTLIDRHNHHLFQPLLYQVATAGLSPADIAAPIRSILSDYPNVKVLLGEVASVDFLRKTALTTIGEIEFDYLVLCCGAAHSYFGHDEWEENAPGLKTLEQATEIRRRVLTAFEEAERVTDPEERKRFLTFVIVGGGPTGVELAGAIREMSRFTLAKDFRSINAGSARVFLIEAGPRILPMFSEEQAARAARDLEKLGVQIWTSSAVTNIDADGVQVRQERLRAATVLWAAGVEASPLGRKIGLEVDPQGRVIVGEDLSVPAYPHVFVAGDQSRFTHQTGKPLPGTAPVAMQQGRYIGRTIVRDIRNQPREPFRFVDKGQMATIGRSKAILEIGRVRLAGWVAWLAWLAVHIYYLTGFKRRLLVVLQWAWSYITFGRGARLIVGKDWRS